MIVTLIAAMSENRVIGRDGDLPWRLPADLKHFKQVTMGKPVIMGRKTWDSLHVKPLPGRRNIVITRNIRFNADGAEIAHSIFDALHRIAETNEAIVIGGAGVFEAALATAQRIYLTEIDVKVEGDTYFPPINPADWREVSREIHSAQGDTPCYSFVLLERQNSSRTIPLATKPPKHS